MVGGAKHKQSDVEWKGKERKRESMARASNAHKHIMISQVIVFHWAMGDFVPTWRDLAPAQSAQSTKTWHIC